ncbi:MAG: ATP-binding protein [Pseudomonadota bacterium]
MSASSPPQTPQTPQTPRRALIHWGLAALGFALILAGVHGWAERRAFAALEERGIAALDLHVELVRGWLSRHLALAPIYASAPDVARALRQPSDGVQLDLTNLALERWTAASGADVTYVLDASGTTVVSSNWATPGSFVGRNYGFRPYYEQAMQGRLGRYFALGIVSGKRGYYFAAPVREAGTIAGTVVVKVPVEPIELELRQSPHAVFATDGSGVIVLAGHPDWRLRSLGPLAPEAIARITESRQFDPAALSPAPIEDAGRAPGGQRLSVAPPDRSDPRPAEFLRLTAPMTVEDWTLHLMVRTAPARAEALTMTLLAAAVLLLLGLGGAWVAQRRRRLIRELADRERAKAALERAVSERTADLTASNAQLSREVAERTQAEEALRQTQTELVQAGKLAALGQMSAALSHEYNQPLAAMRSYAENAIAFLDRGRPEQASENLARIARLTERMAQLSKHLTSFARKPRSTVAPVDLARTVAEALELIRGRLERSHVGIRVDTPANIAVMGGETRLQHVVMNLVGNAIDATTGRAMPEITIRVEPGPDTIALVVDDNGPGIAPELAERLFDPFVTTKRQRGGLGLGLSIAYNILSDFGGSIRAETLPEGGTRMTVTLRRATMPAPSAEPTA